MTEPLDLPLDSPLDQSQWGARLYQPVDAGAHAVTVPPGNPHPSSSSLPWTTPDILTTVQRFGQATSSQLRRLHYVGTDRGTKVRSSYHLNRLTKLHKLRRIPGVYNYGPREYIYTVPKSTADPYDHTLDVTELYVQLTQAGVSCVFDPQPWCNHKIGRMTVNCDACLELSPHHRFYIEVDRSTEQPARLREKMRHYIAIYEQHWDTDRHGEKFPLVVFTARSPERWRTIMDAIKVQREPRLFTCLLFDEVVPTLIAKSNVILKGVEQLERNDETKR